MAPTLPIDGSAPLPVRRPATAAEVGELVRAAAAAGEGVYPAGGRTALDVGLPPAKPGVVLDTTALAGVIDYPARDMTITVRAGTSLAALRAALAAEGQWLPVDVPRAAAATIGGAVALNLSGPRRLGYGTLRDYVIGVSFVADDGTEVKAGGRVVKNVAGYDLMKLHTGAVGTLGVLTQLTLKVRPKPEAAAAVRFGCGGADLAAVLDALHASRSRPVAVHVERAGAGWRGTAVFEEKAATVPWQVDTLLAELGTAPVAGVERLTEDPAALLDRLTDAEAGWLPDGSAARFVWKAAVRPSRTAAVCVAAADLHAGLSVHAEGLNGIVHGIASADPGEAAAADLLATLTALAGDGSVVVRRCPPAWKAALPVWGRPTADAAVMRQVKRALDPGDVFNPGRLFPAG